LLTARPQGAGAAPDAQYCQATNEYKKLEAKEEESMKLGASSTVG